MFLQVIYLFIFNRNLNTVAYQFNSQDHLQHLKRHHLAVPQWLIYKYFFIYIISLKFHDLENLLNVCFLFIFVVAAFSS